MPSSLAEPLATGLRERYGRWALVTGASSGIGAGFADALAAAGMNVATVARRADLLDRRAADIEKRHGVEVRAIAMDLAVPGAAEKLAAGVADLDIGLLVANAGTGWIGRFDKYDRSAMAALIQLHCTFTVQLTSLLLEPMRLRGRGAVVVVASAGAYVPLPYYAVYGATKAFLAMWGEALAEELREDPLEVMVVAPGDTRTGFQQVAGEMSKRWSSVETVVAAALAGLGDKTTVIPGFEDRASIFMTRFLPRRLVARMVGRRQRAQTPTERR